MEGDKRCKVSATLLTKLCFLSFDIVCFFRVVNRTKAFKNFIKMDSYHCVLMALVPEKLVDSTVFSNGCQFAFRHDVIHYTGCFHYIIIYIFFLFRRSYFSEQR